MGRPCPLPSCPHLPGSCLWVLPWSHAFFLTPVVFLPVFLSFVCLLLTDYDVKKISFNVKLIKTYKFLIVFLSLGLQAVLISPSLICASDLGHMSPPGPNPQAWTTAPSYYSLCQCSLHPAKD